MRRWKITALLIGLLFAGIAIAGRVPTRVESGLAAHAGKIHESDDHKRRQMTEGPLPIGGLADASKPAHAFYYRYYHHKRRQVTGVVLSIGNTSGAAIETENFHESYDRNRRQVIALPIGNASGRAAETKITRESSDRNRRQITALPSASPSGGAAETKITRESYDRKRRQFSALSFDFPKSTPAAENQPAPGAMPALPPNRLPVQESRRSISYSAIGTKQQRDPYPSAIVPEISTSSLNKPQPTDAREVNTAESETAEKQASISSSAIPKPVRKPRRAGKSVKITTAKISSKKASALCWNRIWRCR